MFTTESFAAHALKNWREETIGDCESNNAHTPQEKEDLLAVLLKEDCEDLFPADELAQIDWVEAAKIIVQSLN